MGVGVTKRRLHPAVSAPMIADELRRQADQFIDLAELEQIDLPGSIPPFGLAAVQRPALRELASIIRPKSFSRQRSAFQSVGQTYFSLWPVASSDRRKLLDHSKRRHGFSVDHAVSSSPYRPGYTECMDRQPVALRSAARVGSRQYVSGLLIIS